MRDYRRPTQTAPQKEPRNTNSWVSNLVWGTVTLVVLTVLVIVFQGKMVLPRTLPAPTFVLVVAIAVFAVELFSIGDAVKQLKGIVKEIDDEVETHLRQPAPTPIIPADLEKRIAALEKNAHNHPATVSPTTPKS